VLDLAAALVLAPVSLLVLAPVPPPVLPLAQVQALRRVCRQLPALVLNLSIASRLRRPLAPAATHHLRRPLALAVVLRLRRPLALAAQMAIVTTLRLRCPLAISASLLIPC
jgi:hypothetical protein